jgi:hypothetical protein
MWDCLGFLSFVSGSLLISGASTPYTMYTSPYCMGGGLNFCPVISEFNWSPWFFALGVLLVFLAYPIALTGSDNNLDESLILNRTVSGISFMLTGSVVTILGVESLQEARFQVLACPVNYCTNTIFSPGLLLYWIQIFFGLSLAAVGAFLLESRRSKTVLIQEAEATNWLI